MRSNDAFCGKNGILRRKVGRISSACATQALSRYAELIPPNTDQVAWCRDVLFPAGPLKSPQKSQAEARDGGDVR
jgi:hypothetical protein